MKIINLEILNKAISELKEMILFYSKYLSLKKQDKLTAGQGISINENVISNTNLSAEWGNISGNIGDQEDLQELCNKQTGIKYDPIKDSISEGILDSIPGMTYDKSAIANGFKSHAEGIATKALGYGSHSEGRRVIALGSNSHAEGGADHDSVLGYWTCDLNSSIIEETDFELEGINELSVGNIVIIYDNDGNEFYRQIVSKTNNSFTVDDPIPVEINDTVISVVLGGMSYKNGSHSENISISSGEYSHSEGYFTQALGRYSHAEGQNTIALRESSHAEGILNNPHASTIHSIGIGDTNGRKNAIEVMDNGDVYIKGIGGYDGTNPESALTLQQVLTQL